MTAPVENATACREHGVAGHTAEVAVLPNFRIGADVVSVSGSYLRVQRFVAPGAPIGSWAGVKLRF